MTACQATISDAELGKRFGKKAILAGFALCRCGHPRYNHAALAGPCGHSRCLASCDHYTPQEES